MMGVRLLSVFMRAGEGSQAVSRYRVSFLPSASGVSTWEVDALGRARAATDIQEATRILDSFSRLVQVRGFTRLLHFHAAAQQDCITYCLSQCTLCSCVRRLT